MAAARGWMGDIARDWTGLFFPVMPASPCVGKQREELDCAGYQFPNRDHREASPLSSAQQSMDHVFLRDHLPPKICRPLPSTVRFYCGTVSLATGGPQAGEGFLTTNPWRRSARQTLDSLISSPVLAVKARVYSARVASFLSATSERRTAPSSSSRIDRIPRPCGLGSRRP